jgi:hypothetical protein
MRIAAAMLVAAGLATSVTACTRADTGNSDDRCLTAFKNIDPRALPPDNASPLDDAVRACATVAEWKTAWDAVPAAHAGRTDAIQELTNRCAVASLATTAICRELAGG